ncbi:hypothetical protein Nepgr_022487 [Nepenthes gracilis]|uniref:GUN4-like domain-containing protein n=1 Tax=Nepenthes gracilis TaxID=150966 RepID=A0AAD3T2P2_NEPGR|nr:hypothetical protein Nepgr_022487 [Nepenthes gracilis]
MASKSLGSIHQHSAHCRRRHSSDSTPPALPASLVLKSTATTIKPISATHTHSSITFSLSSSATSSPSTSEPVTFDLLQHHLSTQNFRQADEETRRLLTLLAGDPAKKRGYVFFSEVQFISGDDLATIDELWRRHSHNRFGYSVQKRIWRKEDKDFTRFFLKVGWMKKLEYSEVEQYNYRSFPDEFTWDLKEETPPEGHLPLTNALRGTQLLNSIFSHPAFEDFNGEKEDDDDDNGGASESDKGLVDLKGTPLSNRVFKPNYSF